MAEILEDQDGVHHACEAETSMMMVVAPDTVRREKLRRGARARASGRPSRLGVARYVSFRDVTPVAASSATRDAPARRKARSLLAAVRDALAAIVRDPKTWS